MHTQMHMLQMIFQQVRVEQNRIYDFCRDFFALPTNNQIHKLSTRAFVCALCVLWKDNKITGDDNIEFMSCVWSHIKYYKPKTLMYFIFLQMQTVWPFVQYHPDRPLSSVYPTFHVRGIDNLKIEEICIKLLTKITYHHMTSRIDLLLTIYLT